jgi:phytanoyl-CoA dioxygenase PhyH
MSLTAGEVGRFRGDGFVALPGAVAPGVVAACLDVVWSDLGVDPNDARTWTRPVVNHTPSDPRPFRAAFDSTRLFAALDQIVGAGRWRARPDLGNLVLRFPHDRDTGDTGWHIDAGFPAPGEDSAPGDYGKWRVNRESRGRVLLLLFLLTDVGPDDGPTRIRAGSHRDVARILDGVGPEGVGVFAAANRFADASSDRAEVAATGHAGDVYLCHPFLVHAAQVVRGTRPRVIAQPGLAGEPLRSPGSSADMLAPVETSVLENP